MSGTPTKSHRDGVARPAPRQGVHPRLEVLEPRTLPATQLLPDLIPLASASDGYMYGWTLDETEMPGRTLLRLTSAIGNAGAGAMEIRGSTTHPDGTQDVLQRIYDNMGGFSDRLAGVFVHHPEHGHLHMENFALFGLRAVTEGGGVGNLIATGDKTSFCLLDIDQYAPSRPGSPTEGVYDSCDAVRQGISVGWADVYGQHLADQWIDISGVPNGTYWLEVVADPDNRIVESNEDNNATRIQITLTGLPAGPRVSGTTLAGLVEGPLSSAQVTFDRPIDPNSFTPADVQLSGPAGPIPVGTVTPVAGSGNTQFDFSFAEQVADGAYSLAVGADVRDTLGNPMDQDRDGTNSEPSDDRFTAGFMLNCTAAEGFGYRACIVPFETLNLVAGAPGVFTILDDVDDDTAAVNLGTNVFSFYGTSYTGANRLFVSSNGLITFGSPDSDYANGDLRSSPTQRTLAPLWDDLVTNRNPNDRVLGKFEDTNGNGVPDRLIIEWSQVEAYASSEGDMTFQVILYLAASASPGQVVFNYVDLDTGDGNSNAASATVGLKDAGNQGDRRLLVLQGIVTPTVASGRALLITTRPPNQAPVAVPESLATDQGVLLGGNVLANDTDPENNALSAVLVTGPAHGVLTFHDDGSFTYLAAGAFAGADSFSYRASDGLRLSALTTVSLTVRSFRVTALTPTATGFTLQLNRPLGSGVLNLYDQGGTLGPADVTLVGSATGPVRGSLISLADGAGFTFLRTGGFNAASGTFGVLPPDTYQVILRAAANGVQDSRGFLLDGNGDFVQGDDYIQTFTVAAPLSNAVTVSLPDFARGPGQPVNLPANTSGGFPLQISTGLGVLRVELTIHYDAALLTLTGFTLNPALAGATATFQVTTPGTATLSIDSPSSLAGANGPMVLGHLNALVPATAAYGKSHVLDLVNVRVFGPGNVERPSIDDDAIHLAAYFGDLNGSRTYNAPDAALLARVISQVNTGLSAYPLVDPVVAADISLNGTLQANDATALLRVISQVGHPNVPPLPGPLAASPGADQAAIVQALVYLEDSSRSFRPRRN